MAAGAVAGLLGDTDRYGYRSLSGGLVDGTPRMGDAGMGRRSGVDMEYRGIIDRGGVVAGLPVPFTDPAMVWQPIVALTTGKILGYEALARFTAAAPPVVFDSAREQGLSEVLDAHCIAAAIRRTPRSGLIFFNVTAATVRSGVFPSIPATLKDRVVWELPETPGWYPRDLPPNMVLALDDVGAGHAELVRLSTIPWRYVKVDRALVDGVASRPNKQVIIHELLERARQQGGFVIAEGVEREEDAAWLARTGVTYGQGFLWGHPQALDQGVVP